MTYYTKAIYAAVVMFLGSAGAILVGDTTFADFTQGQWVTIILATIIAGGGVLGLQAAPASVATSVKPPK